MNVLGIDYGEKKIGIAIGDTESNFAEPLEVMRYKDEEKAIVRVIEILRISRVSKVIIGISEGKTAEKTRDFSLKLKRKLANEGIKVEEWDETLSTKMAQKLSRQAGMKRKKRKLMEDAFAATFMLQNYLENTQII